MRAAALAKASAVLLFLSSAAWAAEPTVGMTLEVVHASNEGQGVDPGLGPMKEKFAQSGISYSSYHRLSSESVQLAKGKSTEVKLPNGHVATVKVEELRGRKALVRVVVPPVETVYELGKEGSVFVRAGKHGNGVLILVLTPVP